MSLPQDPPKKSSIAASRQGDTQNAPPRPIEAASGSATTSTPVEPLPESPNPQFRFGKRWVDNNGTQMEVFTLSHANETIDLLPLKNWSQLDVHKWRVRGQLPGTPTGLEIAPDHIKLAGEEVYPQQVDACEKLDRRFAEWLKVERDRLVLLKKQADSRAAPPSADEAPLPAQQSHHFEVEKDKSGQVHVRCLQGKETVATIGLTVPGFQSLVSQRLIRQPKTVKTGVLHDWVELDGVLYSFQEGANDSAALAQTLNEKFLPASVLEQGNSIVVFDKAATATGLELQFAARVGGVPDHHRRPLDESTLELLQDADRCGLLQPGIVVKVAAPYVIFKSRTTDGGEEYLPRVPENQVRVRNENGSETLIDLSQQLDYMRLSAAELTAAFNHPTINRTGNPVAASRQSAAVLSKLQTTPEGQSAALCRGAATRQAAPQARPPSVTQASKTISGAAPGAPRRRPDVSSKRSIKRMTPAGGSAEKPSDSPPATKPVEQAEPLAAPRTLPNLWLASILEQPALPYEWFIWLVYGKIAEHVGNSDKARFGNAECWLVSFNGIQEPAQPDFKGVFLVEKHCLGFLSGGHAARFEDDATLLGPSKGLLKATDVRLVAAGMDRDKRCVFIVSEGYRAKFGVPEQAVGDVLEGLKDKGAIVMSVREAFASTQPIEVVWTVPVEQANPAEPQALESTSPAAPAPFAETHHGDGDFASQAA